jgi:hypothetical protein
LHDWFSGCSAEQQRGCDRKQQCRRHHHNAELQERANGDSLAFAAQRDEP